MSQTPTASGGQGARPEVAVNPDELVAHQRNRQLMLVSGLLLVLAVAVAIQVFSQRAAGPVKTSVPLIDLGAKDGKNPDDAGIKLSALAARIEIWSKLGGDHVKLVKDNEVWKLENRFNARAQQADVKTLLDNLAQARRLTRPTSEDESRFALYNLTDEFAAHLKILKADGGEVLHIMVGKGGAETRDFFRFVGADAPRGMYELSDFGPHDLGLRFRLKLNTRDEPEAVSWLDLEDFRTLSHNTELKKLVIGTRDGEGASAKETIIEIAADRTDRPHQYTWRVLKPLEGKGKNTAIEGAVSALRNLSASDIAGRADGDGPKLDVGKSSRWVEIEYIDLSNAMTPAKVRYDFGVKRNNEVALWPSGERMGEYVYWVSDYVLERLFRAPDEYVDSTVTNFARVQHILIAYKGAEMAGPEITRDKDDAAVLANLLRERGRTAEQDAWEKMVDENTADPGWRTNKYYDISPGSGMVKEFEETSLSLKVGEVKVAHTSFGYHVIKRLPDDWQPKKPE